MSSLLPAKHGSWIPGIRLLIPSFSQEICQLIVLNDLRGPFRITSKFLNVSFVFYFAKSFNILGESKELISIQSVIVTIFLYVRMVTGSR